MAGGGDLFVVKQGDFRQERVEELGLTIDFDDYTRVCSR
jgi:hypothetical protein